MATDDILQILQLTGAKEILINGDRWTSINASLFFDHWRDCTRVHVIRLCLVAWSCRVWMSLPYLDWIYIRAHTDSFGPSFRSAAHWGHQRFIWLLGSFSANLSLFVVLHNGVVGVRLLFDIALRNSGFSGLMLLDSRVRCCIWSNFWRFVVLCTSVSCSYALRCDSPVLLILLDFQLRLGQCLIRLLLIMLLCRRLRLRLLVFAAAAKLWRIW